MLNSFNRYVGTVLGAALLALPVVVSLAHGADRGEAKATIGSAKVTIDYGRPALKGRDIQKMIQPGQLWRLGADAPTTIDSTADLDFGGTRVPKGKHILLARLVEPGKWTLVVSSKPAFQFEPGAKLAEIPMELTEAAESVEQVTINLANKDGKGDLEIAWGKMRLRASFTSAR
jgi:hypothetical protein